MKDEIGQPMATYRLQFNREFRFNDAQSLVTYFSRLGVTHVYASPILRARESSTHGYDVVDPKTVNPTLGDETNLINLSSDLRKFGLGLVVDIVPNHMAASVENPYWRDVLTYGHSSPFAGWFDIDWRMPDPDMWGRVLVPVLGERRAQVLEKNQIELAWVDGRFLVKYFEHVFPVDPGTVPSICVFGKKELVRSLPEGHPALDKIAEILGHLKKLPKLAARLRRHVDIDREQTEQWLAQLAQVVMQSPIIHRWAEETAARFGQGDDGRRRLKKLLDNQPYRLVHWRDAARTINYRRFFDINELISIRQEDPYVFQETHASVLRWARAGVIDGLRIDHIDGLRDPLGYLERLDEAFTNDERTNGSIPVFVEKILACGEKLPCGWPVAGTTGYEFLNEAEAIFVSPEGFEEIEVQYRRMLRRPVHFEQIATSGKRRILHSDLSPQVGRLADTLIRLLEEARSPESTGSRSAANEAVSPASVLARTSVPDGGDSLSEKFASQLPADQYELTKRDFVDAIVEVVTALPVYRTYVDNNSQTLSDADRRYVQTALKNARHSGRAAPEAIDFLGEVLLLQGHDLSDHELNERISFIQRFQQLTGPAAAKGIEDTALYAYVPLVSLNEVGGEPELPDDAIAVLHDANAERASTWPRTMLCVTTHDTKRTADVRARLDVLSEIPKLWSGLVRRWRRLNEPHRSRAAGKLAPEPAAEYLFYQTVVGIWPIPDPADPTRLPSQDVMTDLRERAEQYMLKAVREAKSQTSWTNNNQAYEDAVLSFVRSLMLHHNDAALPFLSDMQNLVARIVRPGFWNSLARTLLQFTAPGTPDLYQGDELWNFALVDPDNRRPVDYDTRQELLDDVILKIESPTERRRQFIRDLVSRPEDGRIKLHVIHTALAARREYTHLFTSADYLPLETTGSAKEHIFAFAKVAGGQPSSAGADRATGADRAAVVVLPRWTTNLISGPTSAPIGETVWSDTVVRLPDALRNRNWRCAMTRETIGPSADGDLRVAEILNAFPVACLISEKRESAP